MENGFSTKGHTGKFYTLILINLSSLVLPSTEKLQFKQIIIEISRRRVNAKIHCQNTFADGNPNGTEGNVLFMQM